MKKMLFLAAIAVISLLVMAGCVSEVGGEGPSIDSITVRLVEGDGDSNATGEGAMNVQVDIEVSDFEAGESDEGNASEDTGGDGYFVYYLDRIPEAAYAQIPQFEQQDGQQLPTPGGPGETPAPMGEEEQGMTVASYETSYTWKDLESGIHIFSVELVDTTGTPLSPPAFAIATLVVSVPELEETPGATPELEETPGATPELEETPGVTPELEETPGVTPEAGETPGATPELEETPGATPELEETPGATPEAGETPGATPEAGETPAVTP